MNFITFCGEVPFLYKDTILVPGRAIAPSLPNEHIPILVRVVLVLKIKQCLMLCDVPSAYDGSRTKQRRADLLMIITYHAMQPIGCIYKR